MIRYDQLPKRREEPSDRDLQELGCAVNARPVSQEVSMVGYDLAGYGWMPHVAFSSWTPSGDAVKLLDGTPIRSAWLMAGSWMLRAQNGAIQSAQPLSH